MHSLSIFIYYMYRDYLVHKSRLKIYLINYVIIYPAIYILCFGYIMPQVGMNGQQALPIATLASGMILFSLFPFAMQVQMDLLLDFEHIKFINYQIMILSPRLVLLQKALFSSLLIFLCNIPFYPFVVTILYRYFTISNIKWIPLFFLLYIASLFCCIFSIMLVCAMKNMSKLRFVWRRCNYPLIMVGGFLAPWKVMASYSNILGYIILLNPLLYITEGARQELIGDASFLPYSLCITMLLIFCCLSAFGATYFFKKKLDHI